MKKFSAFAAAAACFLGCAAGLSACGVVGTKKISSADELFAMESGKNYELTCDIDLSGRVWSPLPVKKFNGNGHTISNVTVSGVYSEYNDEYAGFFAKAYGISDVVFDNVNVTANFSQSATGFICGGIVCGYSYNYGYKSAGIKNVTVKNSTMVITSLASSSTYIGGICGYTLLETSNCTVEYSALTVVEANSFNDWLFYGGIVGYSAGSDKDVTDCKFVNSHLNCTALSGVNMGGVIGEMKNGGDIKNCVTLGSEISLDITGCSYVSRTGGIAGNIDNTKSETENVAVKDSVIQMSAKPACTAGGAIGRNLGTVKNCLSDGNEVSAVLTENNSGATAHLGGFCGYNGGTVSRSVAQGCTVSGTAAGASWSSFLNKHCAGFSGYSEGSLAYCGVNGNTCGGHTFTPNQDNVFNCIKEDNASGWEQAVSTLNLDENLWLYDGGLKLKIAED